MLGDLYMSVLSRLLSYSILRKQRMRHDSAQWCCRAQDVPKLGTDDSKHRGSCLHVPVDSKYLGYNKTEGFSWRIWFWRTFPMFEKKNLSFLLCVDWLSSFRWQFAGKGDLNATKEYAHHWHYTDLIISLEQNELCIQFYSNSFAFFNVCHCKVRQAVNTNFFLNKSTEMLISFGWNLGVSELYSSLKPYSPTQNMPDITPSLLSLFPPHSPDSLLHNRHLIRRDWLL